jgi:Cro/C1-type HTH DNA-binding domain
MVERGYLRVAPFYASLPQDELGLSLSQFTRFVTALPDRMNMRALAVVCKALKCGPEDVLRPRFLTVEKAPRERNKQVPQSLAEGAQAETARKRIRRRPKRNIPRSAGPASGALPFPK